MKKCSNKGFALFELAMSSLIILLIILSMQQFFNLTSIATRNTVAAENAISDQIGDDVCLTPGERVSDLASARVGGDLINIQKSVVFATANICEGD